MYFKPIQQDLLPKAKGRFEASYKVVNGCWEWQKSLSRSGYGVFWYDNHNMVAHRISYSLYKGPIPEGLPLDHICANKKCVNPDHLEVVTFKENTSRMHNRKRSDTHCANGHAFAEVGTYERTRNGRKVKTCNKCTEISRLKYRSANKIVKTRLLNQVERALKDMLDKYGGMYDEWQECDLRARAALQSIAEYRANDKQGDGQ